jgi:hypothetical protein
VPLCAACKLVLRDSVVQGKPTSPSPLTSSIIISTSSPLSPSRVKARPTRRFQQHHGVKGRIQFLCYAVIGKSHPNSDNVGCEVFVSGSSGSLSPASTDYAYVNVALKVETIVSSTQGDASLSTCLADAQLLAVSQVAMWRRWRYHVRKA